MGPEIPETIPEEISWHGYEMFSSGSPVFAPDIGPTPRDVFAAARTESGQDMRWYHSHAGSEFASEPPKSPLRPTRISGPPRNSIWARWIFVAKCDEIPPAGSDGSPVLPPYLRPYSLVVPVFPP